MSEVTGHGLTGAPEALADRPILETRLSSFGLGLGEGG